jgi:Uncharacterized protein conserved in bacteria
MRTKKLIINADDFGYTMGTSYGIIETFKTGVVTSSSALTVSSSFLPSMVAVRSLAPSLPLGVHMTVTLSGAKPVLSPNVVPSLVKEDGTFWSRKEYGDKVSLDEVYMEFEAQILRFLESGLYPTHLDTHHSIHGATPQMLQIVADLAKKYKLPMRRPYQMSDEFSSLYPDQKSTDFRFVEFYAQGATLANFEAMLDRIVASELETFELSCHPGFIDPEILQMTAYTEGRINDFVIVTSEEAKDAIKKRNIVLTNYRAIG